MKSVFCKSFSLGMLLVILLLPLEAFALKDPTRPSGFRAPVVKPSTERSFSLVSIIIGADRRIAVIDGQARREGQQFDGVRLKRIYPDRVELMSQGQIRVLKLEPLPQVRSSQ